MWLLRIGDGGGEGVGDEVRTPVNDVFGAKSSGSDAISNKPTLEQMFPAAGAGSRGT